MDDLLSIIDKGKITKTQGCCLFLIIMKFFHDI